MDYEDYNVDPYEPLDIDNELKIIRAEEETAKFFTPTATVTLPGMIFPLEARIFGDAVMTRCRTVADLEATLLGGTKHFRRKKNKK